MSVPGMTLGGATLSISSAALADEKEATLKAATFHAISGLRSLPDLGDEAEVVAFETIEDNRRHKLAGVKDAGDVEIVVVYDLDDIGQSVARNAGQTNEVHGFKLTLKNGSATYFAGIVTSAKQNHGETSAVIQTTYAVAITSGVYFAPAPSGA